MRPANDPRAAAANQRLADQIESVHAGHLAAARVRFAINEGGDAETLIREALDVIHATRDVDRLAAFHRGLQRGQR